MLENYTSNEDEKDLRAITIQGKKSRSKKALSYNVDNISVRTLDNLVTAAVAEDTSKRLEGKTNEKDKKTQRNI